jgi:ectoine hydroxylase-related dioxygenase (phytanoyl-CoA dioxygenase family)
LADADTIAHLIAVIEARSADRLSRGETVFGGRNLLAVPAVGDFTRSDAVRALVEPLLGPQAIPVRGLFFDKTPGANWPVAWHQDLTLAVQRRRDLAGWTNWSEKAGVAHVQPPAQLLEQMLTLRLHLDDCGQGNGPLRVLSGSHRFGRLLRERQNALRGTIPETLCCAEQGAALLMRPLLLHASSPARSPRHRRVLHVEFAAADLLPPEFSWANA